MLNFRRHLQTLCALMAAVWVFSIVAGIAEGCGIAPGNWKAEHAIITDMGTSHHDHASVAAKFKHKHDSHTACAKHCEDSAIGALKVTSPEVAKVAIFTLIFYVLLIATSLQSSRIPSAPLADFLAPLREPPATIRFHRFNN